MPIKDKTRISQHQIDELMKRKDAGEQVTVLAKYYGYSKPGIYRLLKARRDEIIEQALREERAPQLVAPADSQAIRLENQAIKQENMRLEKLLFGYWLQYGALNHIRGETSNSQNLRACSFV